MEDKDNRQEGGAKAPNIMRWVAIALAVAAAVVIGLSVTLIVLATGTDAHAEHHFAAWAQDEEQHWQVCDGCDATTEPATHVWGEWTRTREPDCTQPGEQARIYAEEEELIRSIIEDFTK